MGNGGEGRCRWGMEGRDEGKGLGRGGGERMERGGGRREGGERKQAREMAGRERGELRRRPLSPPSSTCKHKPRPVSTRAARAH